MTWARFDDQFYNHPKLAYLGSYMLPCIGLHTLAICYCSSYLTDGVIPEGQVWRLAGDLGLLLPEGNPWELVKRLIDAGLWENVRGGDFKIHDYLDYNPSRAEVLKLRESRAEIGRRGGLAKAKQTAKQTPSKRLAKSYQKSAPYPYPETEGEGETETPSPSVSKNTTTLSSKLDDAYEILQFLNRKTGRNFQSEVNLGLIRARLKAGATVLQCRSVIVVKMKEWKGTEMEKYLRPATLFNATKFAQYLGELPPAAFSPEEESHA